MKRISVTIDSETLEEIVREFISAEFPKMEIDGARTIFPYFSDFTIRLREKKVLSEDDPDFAEIETPPHVGDAA